MDETSLFRSATSSRRSTTHYVPVRVDNDERPDVNARYNMGGWPTTAFLSPDGSTLTGATYLPPEHMRRALDESRVLCRTQDGHCRNDGASFAARARRTTSHRPTRSAQAHRRRLCRHRRECVRRRVRRLRRRAEVSAARSARFSARRSGARTDNPRFYEIVAHTMRAMARGGMYDHVEGGFFRYSTTRDWSVPHFEKMAEDHAGLLRVLAQLELWAPSATRAPRSRRRSATCAPCCAIRRPDSLPAAKMPTKSTSRFRLEERRAARGALRRSPLVFQLDCRARRRVRVERHCARRSLR